MATTQYVDVKVIDGLSSMFVGVGDEPKAVGFQTTVSGNFGCNEEEVTE